MSFRTDESHEAFRREVRQFAEEKIRPNAFRWDQDNYFPEEIVAEMGEREWLGIPFPKEDGGA